MESHLSSFSLSNSYKCLDPCADNNNYYININDTSFKHPDHCANFCSDHDDNAPGNHHDDHTCCNYNHCDRNSDNNSAHLNTNGCCYDTYDTATQPHPNNHRFG